MASEQEIHFGPFRLDLSQQQVWREDKKIALSQRPWVVLYYLAERPGQIVTVHELLTQLWAGVVVTKAVVKESIRTIRRALDDDAVTPQYIETVGREGYRFIGQVVSDQLSAVSPPPTSPLSRPATGN